MANPRTVVPFGEFLPDRRELANPGLLRAFGVTPLSKNYIRAPGLALPGLPTSQPIALTFGPTPYGFGLHASVAAGARKLYGYYGSAARLHEIDATEVESSGFYQETDRSRLAGGLYAFATAPPGADEFWWFTSFGNNVIATNLEDDVQYLATPGSGNFAKMITSTFAPRAKLAFPILGNLFLAHCALDVTYDGIATGVHPQLVAWSMSHNLRSFGTKSGGDLAFTGSGYQNLDNDFGPITAGIGGKYGIIFQAGGIVRVDGPPYRFEEIIEGDTTLYPYSVFRLDGDVYFWGNAGPSVLRGGEPPVERLGLGKLQRSLLDNRTGFGADIARAIVLGTREVSGAADATNGLTRWAYRPNGSPFPGAADDLDPDGAVPSLLLDYNIAEQRFTVSRSMDPSATFAEGNAGVDAFLRSAPADAGSAWGPFGMVYLLARSDAPGGPANSYFARYELNTVFPGPISPLGFQTGFGRLDEKLTTRPVAIRPLWTNSSGKGATVAAGVSVAIHSKSVTHENATIAGPYTVVGADGWIGTPETVLASHHSVTVEFDGGATFEANEIHEIEGFEVEYAVGAAFGA